MRIRSSITIQISGWYSRKAIFTNSWLSTSSALASAGMRLIGTLHSPVFIIDRALGAGKPASRAISRWVLGLCSMASRRKANVGETGVVMGVVLFSWDHDLQV